MKEKKLFVISVGGSLIHSDGLDLDFIKNFKSLIDSQKNSRFVLITGGGKLARNFLNSLKELGNSKPQDLDWMGIYATRLHAELFRLLFGKSAYKEIIKDPTKKVKFTEKILIAGGFYPGRSTDYVAVALAKTYGAKTVINLSNIDYVYNKDPRQFADATKIENITWKEFRKITGTKWDPGKNVPFDPTAAALAQKLGTKVIITNGKNLENLKNILQEKNFTGTTVS